MAAMSGKPVREASYWEQLRVLLVGEKGEPKLLNTLLISVVLSLPAAMYWSPAAAFWFGFFALIPLAAILGDLTDDLACSLGDTWGALLNVTFGNATEVIICVVAIQHNMFDVIKSSMLGSILGNMLLVLGSAFLVAGNEFSFNRKGIPVYSSLLLVACFALIIPTALAHLPSATGKNAVPGEPFYKGDNGEYVILLVSRFLSIVCVFCYMVFLYYQAVNKHHFEDVDVEGGYETGEAQHLLQGHTDKEVVSEGEGEDDDDDDDDDDDEEPVFSVPFAVTALAIVTVIISIESEVVVGALEPFAVSSGISRGFIAVILLPIVGNVCEHASAIMMAYRGKMDVAIGVAVGSSIQIAVFVIPLLVLVSWVYNGENPEVSHNGDPGALDLNFHPFGTVLMLVSVLVVNAATNVEVGTWITGLFLIMTYVMIAMSYWFLPNGIDGVM
eukprot:TRINITY_DN1870_c1_g1_i3.p1 TRINITY_DN1870_c1_g1~~TRINITY_DN1870_c1_g1_i3.p1  ORF type:complete len:517 (+),score=205.66 TRINITY_DN1870_c1_g1_i3:224-1552(+)